MNAPAHIPEGVILNNPLNLEHTPGITWIGQTPDQPHPKLVKFRTIAYGYRAPNHDLLHHFKGQNPTVKQIVAVWAPAADGNDDAAYTAAVVGRTGLTGEVNLVEDMDVLLHAMTIQEQGYFPWTDADIHAGIALDGVRPQPKPAAPPATAPAAPEQPPATPVATPVPSAAPALPPWATVYPPVLDPIPIPDPAPPERPPILVTTFQPAMPPSEPVMPPTPVDAPMNPFLPSQSTTAAMGSAAAVTLLVWILSLFHVVVPPEAQTALTILISLAAGYAAKGGRAIHTEGN